MSCSSSDSRHNLPTTCFRSSVVVLPRCRTVPGVVDTPSRRQPRSLVLTSRPPSRLVKPPLYAARQSLVDSVLRRRPSGRSHSQASSIRLPVVIRGWPRSRDSRWLARVYILESSVSWVLLVTCRPAVIAFCGIFVPPWISFEPKFCCVTGCTPCCFSVLSFVFVLSHLQVINTKQIDFLLLMNQNIYKKQYSQLLI